jgi:rhamnose utilization protein RhaD (predicted bifunctional aldolase and dehydrogenase)/NAD(P)-dependent dehydrogenase (short-subunit alcohol dehydrogenase family)
MKNLWKDSEARRFKGELGLRVYTSRLLGRDKSLVLHGGGNTSVKVVEKNLFGEAEELLYIKGSGWDLETIEEAGFSPARLAHLIRLVKLKSLSDPQMVNELATHMTRASAPAPSIETILHAILPFKYVDHTHADAVVTITNTPQGMERIRDVYGASVVVIPYVMPGFDLARVCAQRFIKEATGKTIGMVLMNHGIFSFGATARESYERMIHLVGKAERYLARHSAWALLERPIVVVHQELREDLASLRGDISRAAGFPVIMCNQRNARTLSFARRRDTGRISQQGPATPDHIIRTKRVPLLGRDVKAYAQDYRRYFEKHAHRSKEPKTMLDPAPRVVLDRELGLCAVGKTAKEAGVVAEIYAHTMDVIERATALSQFRALPPRALFEVEYWDLEQAKLRKGGKSPIFTGEIALVTGAASGIGCACVEALLARGAAVVGLDINPAIKNLFKRSDFVGLTCDITREEEIQEALESGVRAFGGLDMLVLNAGIFAASNRIEAMPMGQWRKSMDVNLDANMLLMRECHALLKSAPRGGRVVIIGSKNVPAPGPGAAAYSASKAALTQLARVAALEWGADRIRINTIHPNQVFDTAIWTDEVLSARAKQYGMNVAQYRKNNILKTEVHSRDVAEMAAEMCGPLFAKTTGAQVPVDGGNERVI